MLDLERHGLRVKDIATALAKRPAAATDRMLRRVRCRHQNLGVGGVPQRFAATARRRRLDPCARHLPEMREVE